MPSLFDPADRTRLLERLDRLTPETPRRWGTMTPAQMVAHVSAALRMALGDLKVPPRKTIAKNPIVKFLFIHVLPTPRGLPTSKLLKHEPDGLDLAQERQGMRELLERFGRTNPEGTWPEHPAFGALSGKVWGKQQWNHLDHHFKQFGL